MDKKQEFMGLFEHTELEYGYTSMLDVFLEKELEERPDETREWVCKLFYEHFEEPWILVKILRTLAHMNNETIKPIGQVLALDALRHRDAEVRESAVRVFENWGSKEYLPHLRKVYFKEDWLQDYVFQVIRDLEKLS